MSSTILRNLIVIISFALMPCFNFAMEPTTGDQSPKRIKIKTGDEQEYEIPVEIAQVSETLKNMLEDIGTEGQAIPLPEISGQQFDLLLPAMQSLAEFYRENCGASEENRATHLQRIASNLKSGNEPLSNRQLMEFIAGANYLDIPVELPFAPLANQILSASDILGLDKLHDKLKDLWNIHPAKKFMIETPLLLQPKFSGFLESNDGKNFILLHNPHYYTGKATIKICDKKTLQERVVLMHPSVLGVVESRGHLISWSYDTIKVWDLDNLQREPSTFLHVGLVSFILSENGTLISWSRNFINVWDIAHPQAKPITLEHEYMNGVKEVSGGKLISWSCYQGIKIWDIQNLQAEPDTLLHSWVSGVTESAQGNLISWSEQHGTIIVWDMATFEEVGTLQHKIIHQVMNGCGGKLISWSLLADAGVRIWDMQNLQAKPIVLKHKKLSGVVERRDGTLITWSNENGTIRIWDRKTYKKLASLRHKGVQGISVDVEGKMISWSCDAYDKCAIKVWDMVSFQILSAVQHVKLSGIRVSMDGNLITWSLFPGELSIKVWGMQFYKPTSQLIMLAIAVYSVTRGTNFLLTAEERAAYKALFVTLSPWIQHLLEKQAPKFIADIQLG